MTEEPKGFEEPEVPSESDDAAEGGTSGADAGGAGKGARPPVGTRTPRGS